jgi:hypothetical protein
MTLNNILAKICHGKNKKKLLSYCYECYDDYKKGLTQKVQFKYEQKNFSAKPPVDLRNKIYLSGMICEECMKKNHPAFYQKNNGGKN